MRVHGVPAGKRAEGEADAASVALYGFPRHCTYDTWVALTLARSTAVAALARVAVTADKIASGGLGPREYYPTEEAYLEALLRSRLSSRR